MIIMNNLLADLLHYLQQTQKDMTCSQQSTQQSQRDHANDTLIDNIPTFDGKLESYFDWIQIVENYKSI